jgi:hypothetical protein
VMLGALSVTEIPISKSLWRARGEALPAMFICADVMRASFLFAF